MKTEKVTRKLLRQIRVGETAKFELPTGAACESAKVLAWQLKNVDNVKFSAKTDYSKKTVFITRLF